MAFLPASTDPQTRFLNEYLRCLPAPTEWHLRQVKVVGDKEQYETAIRSLTTANMANRNSHNESIRSFQVLIDLSYCAVLQKKKLASKEQLDRMMQRITNVREKDRRRLLIQVLRINTLICELVRCGWSIYFATELFFLNPLPPFKILRLSNETWDQILERLLDDKYAKHDFSATCLQSEYTIPGLIAAKGNSTEILSIDEICDALGYDPATFPRSVNPIHTVRPPKGQTTLITTLAPMVFADQATAILQDSFQLPSIKDVLQSSLQLPEEALLLLSLLCSFAPPLYPMDTFLLEACGMRRARWHPCGDPEYFCAEDIGVDPAITNMLRNLTALEHYLGSLEDAKCITRQHGKVEMVAGVISPEIPQDQVVKLACFYYLGCEYSIDYAKIGNSALSLFRRVINQYFRMPNRVRLPLKPLVIDSLLQASKFSTLSWKREIIAIIEREGLESLDNHSKAYFVVRKAFVLRSGGNCRESLELLRDYLHRVPTPLDRKMNAIYGLLTSAMALNLWEIGNFDDAMSSWERWPAQSNSTYESRVAVQTLAHIGRAMLYRRRFHEAVCALKSALESYDRSRPRLDITANLCDAYCESGDREAALKLVASEEPSLTDYLDDRYKRNLAVSYAAAFVCARQYDQAEALLLKLKERFEGKRSLERVDKRRCIRTLLLFAQNLHHQATSPDQWTETKRRWKDVVDSMDGFDEVTEWDFGMVCFSMHHAVQELGGDGGNCWSRRGNEMFARKGKFWMVGMTTYWLQFLSQKVQLPAWITDIGKHSANLYGT